MVVPTDFFDFVSKLRSRLVAPAVAMSTSFRDECERRLDQAENMITQPQDWYSHSTGTKRSIFSCRTWSSIPVWNRSRI